jgi:SAM-dependent methyltransferase
VTLRLVGHNTMTSTDESSPSSTIAYYDTHARELYEPFLRHLPPEAHILDAGCGSGRDTKAFLARGYRVTAIDASPILARLATAFTGQHCEVIPFQELTFRKEFDGVWACASLLHIPKGEMHDVIPRFIHALKPGGVIYLSLKEGYGERFAEGGRFFSLYTADSFRQLLAHFPTLHEIEFWKTDEIRSLQPSGLWLNFLMRKVGDQR